MTDTATTTTSATTLPADLPVPEATNAALHLGGHPLPPLIELPSTSGGFVDLFLLSLRRPVLLFIYPRTAAPDELVPDDWNAIAGARGCTPELCNVRDHYQALLNRERRGNPATDESSSLAVFGLSTQSTAYQREAVKRLQLPFPLLSDGPALALQKALDLPTFTWRNETFLQRCTLLLRDGQVTQYQHPVFPPNKAAEEALKMLDAGKSKTPAAAASEMPISSAYVLHSSVKSEVEGVEEQIGRRPRDLTGSIRSFAGLQRLKQQSSTGGRSLDWRNSLVAVDTHTGEVVGVLAHGVTLSSDDAAAVSPLSEADVDEIPTPSPTTAEPVLLPYTSAAAYHDPDVRPRSRANSVLGADTFAPPPVPEKVASHHMKQSDGDSDDDDDDDGGESMDCFSDGEAVDGLVRTRATHVERHRPDLLRDEYDRNSRHERSDVSGSTVGGPAVQLWRKARGGRKGEEKRRAKKEAKAAGATAAAEWAAAAAKKTSPPSPPTKKPAVQATSKAWSEVRDAVVAPAVYPPSTETIDAARAQRRRQRFAEMEATSQGGAVLGEDVQSIEDNVWRSALESGALPIDGAYTHLPVTRKASSPHPQQGVVNAPMQGNSVLIEFLAGSRITASVVRDAASSLFRPQSTPASTAAAAAASAQDGFSPTALALRYMPVLPDHLLWFFGMGEGGAKVAAEETTAAPLTTATMTTTTSTDAAVSGDLLRAFSATSVVSAAVTAAIVPTQWIASTAWQLGVSAGGWLGSGLMTYVIGVGGQDEAIKAATANRLTDEELYRDWSTTQPGDEDADEWEWQMPPGAYAEAAAHADGNELANTPRPVYRRKRPIPSMYGGFNVRESAHDRIVDGDDALDGKRQRREGSRYSIIHFDNDGVGRHAVMRAGFSP